MFRYILLLTTFISVCFCQLLVKPQPVRADAGKDSTAQQLEQIAQEINDTTMSPFCPGRTLGACPSPQARELRMQVLEWLKSGQSPEEVADRLVNMYGQEVTGVPKSEGFGTMAWLAPIFFLAIFLAAIMYAMKRMQMRSAAAALASPAHADQAMKSRIEEELKSRMR